MSSILETFYILFKTNADDVQKGTKKAKSETDKFGKSITESENRTKAVGEAFTGVVESVGLALAGVLAVGKAIETVNKTIQQTQALRITSMATGDTPQQIDAIERAAKRFGATTEETQGVLKSLNSQILDTAFSGESSLSPVLRRLGMNLRNAAGDIVKPVELLDQLNVSFQKVSKRESLNLGAKMGLSESMILMLQQTPEMYKKSIQAAQKWGAVTQGDIVAVNKFDMSLNDMTSAMGVATRSMIFSMIPAMTSFVDGLNSVFSWVQKNADIVKLFFIGTATAITAFYMPAIISAGAATIVALAPILAIAAAVIAAGAAFAILYDEVSNFIKGNKSLIGDAVKRWPILGVILNTIIDSFKLLIAIAGLFADLISLAFKKVVESIGEIPKAWENFIDYFKSSSPFISKVIEGITDVFRVNAEIIKMIFKGVGDYIKMIIDGISSGIKWATDKVSALRGMVGGGADVADLVNGAKSQIDFAASAPIASQTSSSISNSRISNAKAFDFKIDNVNVQTQATDAQGISAAVGQTLSQQMKQAMFNIDDGLFA